MCNHKIWMEKLTVDAGSDYLYILSLFMPAAHILNVVLSCQIFKINRLALWNRKICVLVEFGSVMLIY